MLNYYKEASPLYNMSDASNSSSKMVGNNGTLDMVVTLSPLGVFAIVSSAAVSVVGTFGNLLLISAILLNRSLRVFSNAFLLNLATADLVVVSITEPFRIFPHSTGDLHVLAKNEILCHVLSSMCVICCTASAGSIVVISIHRYVSTCHPNMNGRIFRSSDMLLWICGIWLVAVVTDMPNNTGLSRRAFDGKLGICLYDRHHGRPYTSFLLSIVLGYIAITLISYSLLFSTVRMHRKRFAYKQTSTDDIRLARALCMAFIFFVVCWLPIGFLMEFDRSDAMPPKVYEFLVILAHANSALNWIIYGVSIRRFRKAYLRNLRWPLTILKTVRGFFSGQSAAEERSRNDWKLQRQVLLADFRMKYGVRNMQFAT